jgi:hypothetical protein
LIIDKDYMKNISIDNYEAYYLDLLEGNLGEEETALLLNFLEENPHLKIDDDFLPHLNEKDQQLEKQFKANLKQVDLNNDVVTVSNAEHYIIAETEGLLSPDKSLELNDILEQNSQLKALHKIYRRVQLKADTNIIFADKHLLKQKATFRLWPAIAFAAAASVTAFFFLLPTSETELKGSQGLSGIVGSPDTSKGFKTIQSISVTNPSETQPTNSDKIRSTPNPEIVRVAEKHSVGEIALRTTRPFHYSTEDLELIENTLAQETFDSRYQKSDYAVLGIQDMNNPIKPITNRIGDLVKQDVDFRTAKTTEKNSGGFYIKIGKFEVSHKKH